MESIIINKPQVSLSNFKYKHIEFFWIPQKFLYLTHTYGIKSPFS